MQSMLIPVLMVSAALGVLLWSVAAGPDPNRTRVATNLKRGMKGSRALPTGDMTSQAPGVGKARHADLLSKLVMQRARTNTLEKLWQQAGRPLDWPVERLVTGKVVLTLVGLFFAAYFLLVMRGTLGTGLGLLTPVVLHFLPELLLYSRAMERREQIGLELADTLDQMSIAVEAGLGFDAAMVRVAKTGQGVLAQELIRTLQDIQVGQTRRQAYEDLAERTQVADLRQFIRSIIQAETYGLALSNVLNTQAAEMRLKRRQRAEAKAMQIPVKVVIPLMICILPCLFMIVLGPGVINIVATMMG